MKTNVVEYKFLPFELEAAPYGTLAKVTNIEPHYYLQCGEKEINWIPLTTVLLTVHINDLNDQKFIDNLLKSYNILTR